MEFFDRYGFALADSPGEAMWETYRREVLNDMGEISTGICRDVFFSGMAMAMAYFHCAMNQDEKNNFIAMMQRLSDELEQVAADMVNHPIN